MTTPTSTRQPASAIRTEGLSKRYGETHALAELDLAVAPGEVYGYLGPNGAGKTTTIRLLLGLHRPSAGRAELFGIDSWSDPVQAHRRLAYVAGEPFLWPSLTAAETFELLARLHGGTDTAYRDRLVRRFQLDTRKKLRSLSKGNRQKVQLVAALATRADLLLLDEPTSGLDPLMEMAFRESSKEAKERGQAVFLSSHILNEFEAVCDRVGILRAGRRSAHASHDRKRRPDEIPRPVKLRGMTPDSEPLEVLIAGGGVAGLEATLALRDLAGDLVRITLISPNPEFVYRPLTVREPFAYSQAARYPLRRIADDLGAELVEDSVAAIDPDERTVRAAGGQTLGYDALLVGVGAQFRARYEHVATVDDRRLDELLSGMIQDVEAGLVKRLAFVVPPRMAWPLPLYELALMTAARAYDMNVDTAITLLTPESGPLAVFGPEVSGAVTELLARHRIEVIADAYCEIPRAGRITVTPGDRELEVDRIVALPELDGPAVAGLPVAEDGFIPVDEFGAVRGVQRLFAAGDATDFPVKHGGLAAQQADAAARVIAGLAGADVAPEPFDPEIRGILLTGGTPLYLSAFLAGGHGTTSRLSEEPPSPPHGKIAAKYLMPYLETLFS